MQDGQMRPAGKFGTTPCQYFGSTFELHGAMQDGQVRLWDLRANQCQGFLACPPGPCCTFDEQVSSITCSITFLLSMQPLEPEPFLMPP